MSAGAKLLSAEEIRGWREEYGLDGKAVYQLDAEFTSLVKIQVQELQKEISKIQKTLFNTSEKEAEAAKVQMYGLQELLKDVQSQSEISLACFLEFSDCTQDKFKSIMDRIMFAFNVDVVDPHARINFLLYMRIKCFLGGQTTKLGEEPDKWNADKGKLLDLWMGILNPQRSSTLAKKDLRDLFEKFARGKMQEEPILISEVFADNMIKLFEMEGLEDPNGDPNEKEENRHILVAGIRDKIRDGTFEIDLLNQLILKDCEYKVCSKNFHFD